MLARVTQYFSLPVDLDRITLLTAVVEHVIDGLLLIQQFHIFPVDLCTNVAYVPLGSGRQTAGRMEYLIAKSVFTPQLWPQWMCFPSWILLLLTCEHFAAKHKKAMIENVIVLLFFIWQQVSGIHSNTGGILEV